MRFSAAVSWFVVLFLAVTVGEDIPDWSVKYDSSQICAPKRSTVKIQCTYQYPSKISWKKTEVESRFWFTKGNNQNPLDLKKDSDYTGRVQQLCEKEECSLRISDLKQSDSGVYKFRFITNQPGGSYTGLPGVNVTVTDLRVQIRRSELQTELKCESSCDKTRPPSYVWFNNRKKMEQKAASVLVSVRDDDSYSCSVKGHEDHRSPSVYPPKLPSVKLVKSIETNEGNSVILACSSDAKPAAIYTWRKKNNPTVLSENQQFVLSSILPSHSGQYYCTAKNELGERTSRSVFVDVKYAPRSPSVRVDPSGDIMEGSKVTLICSSDANPAAKYTWRKKNNPTVLSKNQQFVLSSILSSDSGQFYCTAKNELGERTSGSVSVDVKYAPRPPSVTVTPSGDIMEGSTVTLTCSSDANPAAKYTWNKEGEETRNASGQNFTISNIMVQQGGRYYCEAQNSRGRSNSTVDVNVVAGSLNRVVAAAVTALLLALILICLVLWIIRIKAWKQKSIPEGEQVPGEPVKPAKENVAYADVHFTKKYEEQLYSNIRPAQSNRQKDEETEYSTVNFDSVKADPRAESKSPDVVDPAALYSTVNKPRKNSTS